MHASAKSAAVVFVVVSVVLAAVAVALVVALLAVTQTYLWLVGNGRMVVMVPIIVPIPPFPTNQR